MKFESRLAARIAAKSDSKRSWKTYASFAGIVFIVLTLTSSTLAVPQAVVHMGTSNSAAKYLGQFDGRSNVLLLGVTCDEDWISIKTPFKGHLADLDSVSFSLFATQMGGGMWQPYVVLKMTEGKNLIWHPENLDASSIMDTAEFSWQEKDAAIQGKWTLAPAETQSLLAPLDTWAAIMGDRDVICIYICVGKWDVTDLYQCYLGDLAVNGKLIDLANAGRISGSSKDLPPGF